MLLMLLVLLGQVMPVQRAHGVVDGSQLSGVAQAYAAAYQAFQHADYAKTHQVIDELLQTWGPRGLEVFGPRFGEFFFLKGLTFYKQEDYEAAIEMFQTCYEKYNNSLLQSKPSTNPYPWLANRFRMHARLQWARSRARLNDYDAAIPLFEEILALKEDVRPPIYKDQVGVELGRSLIRNGDLEKGHELLIKILESKASQQTKKAALMVLFQDWSVEVDWSEVQPVAWKYGHIVKQDTKSARFRRNPIFNFLARKGLTARDPLRALTWYAFFLHPQEAVEIEQQRLRAIEAIKLPEKPAPELVAEKNKRLADQHEKIAIQENNLTAMILGVASAHYQLKNFGAAFVTFVHLADTFPEHEKRPEILYNVVSSSVHIREFDATYEYGLLFLTECPDHPLKPEVARLMAEAVFLKEEYQKSYDVAVEIREFFDPGSAARDVLDFVAGASLYHLERYEEAEPELATYITTYAEKGQRLEPARFYLGAAKVKLFKWAEASEILHAFIEDYPRSLMLASALYQAALCDFVLVEYDKALALLDRLQNDHPGASEIPASYNLRGDVLDAMREPSDAIEAAYSTGRNGALPDPEQKEVAAYSLWKLIHLACQAKNHELAVARDQEFRSMHGGSIYELEATAAALPSLVALDRFEEARRRLENFIIGVAYDPASPRLSELVGTWVELLEDNLPPDEAFAQVKAFPLPEPRPEPLAAWLLMAEIEKLETADPPVDPKDLNSLYYRIQFDYEKEQIPNYILVKLARWNRETMNKPELAQEFYNYVLHARPEGGALEYALLDSADDIVRRGARNSFSTALDSYQRILDQYEAPEFQEGATLGIARILTAQEKNDQAFHWWQRYLSNRSWSKARPEANYRLGSLLEKAGKPAEAIKIYVSVYSNFPGYLDWSTKAYLNTAEILRQRGQQGDALKVLIDMLKRMGHLEHPGILEAREKFNTWKAEWVATNK
jgi:tetratricopeptide (TPR) repeat protein